WCRSWSERDVPVVCELLTGQGDVWRRRRRRGVIQHEVVGARRRLQADDGMDCAIERAVPVRTASTGPGARTITAISFWPVVPTAHNDSEVINPPPPRA